MTFPSKTHWWALAMSFSLFLLCAVFISLAGADSSPTWYRFSPQQQALRPSDSKVHSLDFTSASPHIFSSLRSLLQQWPNVFFPNGHLIVPCEVKPFTNLYHGRRDADPPPNPEWFAFDIEMSYGIMGFGRNSHMFTYQTVKPVQCLYFDGMSAALSGTGQLDSQMVFLYGNTTGPPRRGRFPVIRDEYRRAQGLCAWVEENALGGLGWGVEGIVRMNAGFEMIWCNFSSPSIRLISHLNVTVPLVPGRSEAQLAFPFREPDDGELNTKETLREREALASRSRYSLSSHAEPLIHQTDELDGADRLRWVDEVMREPFIQSGIYEWYRSATWHYGITGLGANIGESRIKSLGCAMRSYYNPLFTTLASTRIASERNALNLTLSGGWKGPGRQGNRTLALQQLSRRRRRHTLEAIAPEEAKLMNVDLLKTLTDLNSSGGCHGIDWATLTSDISSRYSRPLSQFVLLLSQPPSNSSNATATRQFIAAARSKSHAFLLPFLEYSAFPPYESDDAKSQWTLDSAMGQAAFSRCKYAHTRLLYDSDGHLDQHIVRPEEALVVSSVEDVLSAICATTISTGLAVEHFWQSHFNQPKPPSTSKPTPPPPPPPSPPHLNESITTWRASLEELLAWLGWAGDAVWCDRLCALDEVCNVPFWPLMLRRMGRPGGRPPPPPPGYGTNGSDPHRDPYGSQPPGYGRPPGENPGADPFGEDMWHPKCVKWID